MQQGGKGSPPAFEGAPPPEATEFETMAAELLGDPPTAAQAAAAAKITAAHQTSSNGSNGGVKALAPSAAAAVSKQPSSSGLKSLGAASAPKPKPKPPPPVEEMPTAANNNRVYVKLRGWWETPATMRRNRLWALEGMCNFPGCPLADRHSGPHQFCEMAASLHK